MLFFIVLFIAALSFAADALTQHIPFEVEQRLVNKIDTDDGDAFADSIVDSTKPLPVYLQTLADDLSQKMNLPAEMKINVSVVKSDVVNAFATLGGNVVFFSGLLDTMPNENTLGMVMAHEIAHIKLRHPLRALGRGVVVGLAVATVAGSSANGIVDELIGGTGLLTALSFTRDQESAADKLAVAALVARYGHAEGSTELFKLLDKEHADANGGSKMKVPEFFATHPLGKNRIEAIGYQLQENNWAAKGDIREIPESILTEITQLHKKLKGPKEQQHSSPSI